MTFPRKRRAIGAVLKAACAYSATVFAAGFALGTIRIFVLMPITGELGAVLLELPVILAISWLFCGAVIRRFAVLAGWRYRSIMGAAAFVLLMLAELGLSVIVFQRPAEAFLLNLASPAGAIGLAGQVTFALFPLFRVRFMPPCRRP